MKSAHLMLQFFTLQNANDIFTNLRSDLNQFNIFATYEQYKLPANVLQNHLVTSNNPQTSLGGLRDISLKLFVKKVPVLLLSNVQSKNDALTIPLLFPRMIKQELPILVYGCNSIQKDLLQTKVNLTFKKIPDQILSHKETRLYLETRSTRQRSFKELCIPLTQILGLPKAIQNFLKLVIGNQEFKPIPEIILNLILLSDFQSRYAALLFSFEHALLQSKQPVSVLLSSYLLIINDLPFPVFKSFILKTIQEYLHQLPKTSKILNELKNTHNHNDLLILFIQAIWRTPEDERDIDQKEKLLVWQILSSGIILHRSQKDCDYWQEALFMDQIESGTPPYQEFLAHLVKYAQEKTLSEELSTDELLQNHLQKSLHYYTSFFQPYIADDVNANVDQLLIQQHFLSLLFSSKTTDNSKKLPLNMDSIQNRELHYPPNVLVRTYAHTVKHIIQNKVKNFIGEGLGKQPELYQDKYFPLLYDSVIASSGFPLSQNTFALWLRNFRILHNLESKGYVPTTDVDEKYFMSLETLTANKDFFPRDYKSSDFFDEFDSIKQEKDNLFNKLTILAKRNSLNPTFALFASLLKKSEATLWTALATKKLPPNSLQKLWFQLVKKAAIHSKLCNLTNADYIVLKLPKSFKNLLYLGNSIKLKIEKQPIQIYFIASNTNTTSKLDSLSVTYLRFLYAFLKKAEYAGIAQFIKILDKILPILYPYFYFLSLQTIDLLLYNLYEQNAILQRPKIKELKNKIPDSKKLFIGNMASIKVNTLLQANYIRIPSKEIPSISIGSFVQSARNYYSVITELETIYNNTNFLLNFVNFSTPEPFKRDNAWQKLVNNLNVFASILNKSVDSMQQSEIQALHEAATSSHELIVKLKPTNNPQANVLGFLLFLWQKKFPNKTRKFDIYSDFLMAGETGRENNLLIQLRDIQTLFSNLSEKQCIIILPEIHKRFHFDYVIEIGRLLSTYKTNCLFYLNTSNFTNDQLLEVSAYFHPHSFFQADDLKT